MNPFAGQANEEVFSFLVCSTDSMESIQKARLKNTVQKNVVECLRGASLPDTCPQTGFPLFMSGCQC